MSVFVATGRKLFKQPPEDELKDLKEELEEIVVVPSKFRPEDREKKLAHILIRLPELWGQVEVRQRKYEDNKTFHSRLIEIAEVEEASYKYWRGVLAKENLGKKATIKATAYCQLAFNKLKYLRDHYGGDVQELKKIDSVLQ